MGKGVRGRGMGGLEIQTGSGILAVLPLSNCAIHTTRVFRGKEGCYKAAGISHGGACLSCLADGARATRMCRRLGIGSCLLLDGDSAGSRPAKAVPKGHTPSWMGSENFHSSGGVFSEADHDIWRPSDWSIRARFCGGLGRLGVRCRCRTPPLWQAHVRSILCPRVPLPSHHRRHVPISARSLLMPFWNVFDKHRDTRKNSGAGTWALVIPGVWER